MRRFVVGLLLVLLATPAFAADPADRELAIQFERSLQKANKTFREANASMQAMIVGMTTGKTPAKEEAEATLDAYEKAVANFRKEVRDLKTPQDPETIAYATAASRYLNQLGMLSKEQLAPLLDAKSRPAGEEDALNKATALAPLLQLASNTALAAAEVGKTRKAFLKAHNITSADLAAASAATSTAGAPATGDAPPSTTTPTTTDGTPGEPASEPAAPAVPLTGPAALHKAIQDGEKAFRDSTTAVGEKLLAKVALGNEIDAAEVTETFSGIEVAIASFEAQLASVQIPDDPESKAYASAARRLIGHLKKADFKGIAKLLTDKTLTAEARQNALLRKSTGLETALKKEFANFEKARKAFTDKHKLETPTGDSATTPIEGSPAASEP